MAPVTPPPAPVELLDLPLGPGRQTLRLALTRGPEGDVEALLLVLGFGSGLDFHRPAWLPSPLAVPGSALPQLQEALEVLAGEGDAVHPRGEGAP